VELFRYQQQFDGSDTQHLFIANRKEEMCRAKPNDVPWVGPSKAACDGASLITPPLRSQTAMLNEKQKTFCCPDWMLLRNTHNILEGSQVRPVNCALAAATACPGSLGGHHDRARRARRTIKGKSRRQVHEGRRKAAQFDWSDESWPHENL